MDHIHSGNNKKNSQIEKVPFSMYFNDFGFLALITPKTVNRSYEFLITFWE